MDPDGIAAMWENGGTLHLVSSGGHQREPNALRCLGPIGFEEHKVGYASSMNVRNKK
jgi:hypothetical protein